jgi:plasmid stabilization system protein ParE
MNPVEYRVAFDPLAEIEALDAAAYIARDSPRNAARWYEGLQKAIKSLSLFPHRCAVAPEAKYLARELRHYIYKSHRVIFEIVEDDRLVRVLHIRHSARRAMGEPDANQ